MDAFKRFWTLQVSAFNILFDKGIVEYGFHILCINIYEVWVKKFTVLVLLLIPQWMFADETCIKFLERFNVRTGRPEVLINYGKFNVIYDFTNRSALNLKEGDRKIGPHGAFARPLYPPELTDFSKLKGLVVVDSGCGGGQFVADLIEDYGVEQAIGFDLLRPNLADRHPGHFFRANAARTGLRAGSVNIIYSTFSTLVYEAANRNLVRDILLEDKRILSVGGELRTTGFNRERAELIKSALAGIGGLTLAKEYVLPGFLEDGHPELVGQKVPIETVALRIVKTQ